MRPERWFCWIRWAPGSPRPAGSRLTATRSSPPTPAAARSAPTSPASAASSRSKASTQPIRGPSMPPRRPTASSSMCRPAGPGPWMSSALALADRSPRSAASPWPGQPAAKASPLGDIGGSRYEEAISCRQWARTRTRNYSIGCAPVTSRLSSSWSDGITPPWCGWAPPSCPAWRWRGGGSRAPWVGVLRGIGGFEGRSSFRTWLFRILVNRARTAGERERRSVALGDADPAVDPARFDETGHWLSPPEHWIEEAEDRLSAAKMADRIRSAIKGLPARQREVVTLRDVEGLSSEEVCGVLAISEGNQRVLLHRGRSRLRQIIETEFGRP